MSDTGAQATRIWFLHDEKPGHLTQLKGLEASLQRHTNIEAEWIPAGCFNILKANRSINTAPDIVVGAGHKTHTSVFFASKWLGALSVVLMNPSLPKALFDFVICPEHDGLGHSNTILSTVGTINKMASSERPSPQDLHLILIGGPSKHYQWHNDSVVSQVTSICQGSPNKQWYLFDSRRTPSTFINLIEQAQLKNLHYYDHKAAGTPPLSEYLVAADEIWVSADSASMIYEALSVSTKVGLMPLPPSSKNSRIVNGVNALIEKGYLSRLSAPVKELKPSKMPRLNEADRAAKWLIKKYQEQRGKNQSP